MSIGFALVYHRVGPKRGNPRHELYPTLDLPSFRDQLDWVEPRYRLVRASELPNAVSMRGADDPIPLALTFDDDVASHAEFVLPELLVRGIEATFFLSGMALDDSAARPWWELLEAAAKRAPGEALGDHSLAERAAAIESMAPRQQASEAERLQALADSEPGPRALDADGIRRLAEAGMEIGFHTLGHHRLPDLTAAEIERALSEGRERLAHVVGRELSSIAYPHGATDAVVIAAARRARYATGFNTDGTPIRPASDPLNLGRVYPPPSQLTAG